MRLRIFSLQVLAIAYLFATAQLMGRGTQLSPGQRTEIDRYVTAELARQRIPGAEVGIYRDGTALLEKGYGLANVELQVPVRPETMMQSGSVGKQFAATAVMMLVEQGRIGLDDSITKYFPDAPASWQPIRVNNLLSHTSGLAEYESDALTKPGGEFYLRLDFTEDQLVHKIEQLPIEFKPGDDWNYRNTNYALLGILIHRVTGMFYGDYLHEKIFAPLGMNATRIISDRDIIPNRAAGYEIDGGTLKNQEFVSPTFNSTADGTLYFNVVDLEKWDRALYGASVLTKASLDRMWTPFLLNDGKANSAEYGFAWSVGNVNGHRVIEHTGAWQGFTCIISRYVDDKLTVVVLTNLDAGHARPQPLERVVAGLVEPSLMPKPRPAIADAKSEIAATLRAMLRKAVTGADAGSYFTAEAGYDASYAADLSSNLPSEWDNSPFSLISRTESKGVVTSSYRVGRAGDSRLITMQTDAAGKIQYVGVFADPDNR